MRDSGLEKAMRTVIATKLGRRPHDDEPLARSVRNQAEPVSRHPAPGSAL
jgi:hypothetical protein